MPIAQTDRRLLEGMLATKQRTRALDLPGKPGVLRDLAFHVLDEGYLAFKAALEREDAEEVQAMEARAELTERRGSLHEAFTRLYIGLQTGLLQRRLEGGDGEEGIDLSTYLERFAPSALTVASLDVALSVTERARAFGDRFLPESVRGEVLSFADGAIERTRAAKAKLEQESAEAVQALADLEELRQLASDAYLSARDVLSAALRLSGQLDKLSQIAPPLRDIVDGNSGRSAEVRAPADV